MPCILSFSLLSLSLASRNLEFKQSCNMGYFVDCRDNSGCVCASKSCRRNWTLCKARPPKESNDQNSKYAFIVSSIRAQLMSFR